MKTVPNDLPSPGGVYNITLRTLASPNRLRKRSTCKTLIIKVSADVENHLKKKCTSLPAKLFRHFFQTFFFPAGPIFPPVSCPHFLVTGLGPAPSAPPQDFPPENKFSLLTWSNFEGKVPKIFPNRRSSGRETAATLRMIPGRLVGDTLREILRGRPPPGNDVS